MPLAIQATCGDKNGAAAGTDAVTTTDCGTGFLYQSSQSAALCAGATCIAASTDRATCCVAQATCGDKNGAAAGTDAVTDTDCGAGFLYQSSQSTASCAGATCIAGTTDKSTCCVAQATCGDKNGAAAGTDAVTDTDCGAGFLYQSSQSSASCAGATCITGTTDKSTCCVAQATCGDTNGASSGTVAVSNLDCGTGYNYQSSQSTALCSGAACVAGSDPDRAVCCVELTPMLSDVAISSTTEGEANLLATSNKAGKIKWAVLLATTAVPSASSINSGAAPGAAKSGVASVAANVPAFVDITGLLASTSYATYVLAVDVTSIYTSTVTVKIFTSAADSTAPLLSGVVVQPVSEFRTTAVMTSDEGGKVFWAVLLTSAAVPTSASVKAGVVVGAKQAGVANVAANVQKTVDINGLATITDYALFIVVEDEAANTAATMTAKSFTTPADVTNPSLSGISVNSTDSTTASLAATLDDDGNVFWVVLPKIYSAPTVTMVVTGDDSRAKSKGSVTVERAKPRTSAIAGLQAQTEYTAYIAGVDEANNAAVSMVAVSFATPNIVDIIPPILSRVSVSLMHANGGVLKATSDEAGMFAWAVVLSDTVAPSLAEVKAGTSANFKAGDTQIAVGSGVEVVVSIEGLAEITEYMVSEQHNE